MLRRALAILLWLGLVPAAAAQTPGDFDYYVLALSWSPSYCETARGDDREQCGRRLGFVVHGLWPQYDRGFPLACQTREPPPTPQEVTGMLDLFPTSGLARHEWRQHGTCSGLSVRNYFDVLRAAYGRVKLPAALPVQKNGTVAPFAVEASFIAANPGLPRQAIAVSCDDSRLTEVRVCLTKDLSFRPCPEVDSRACRRPQVRVPTAR
jgi:ribonuclease T2